MSDSANSPEPGRPPTWAGLFRTAAEPVFVLNHRRVIRYANPAWERLTGLRARDVFNRKCSRQQDDFPALRALAPPAEVQDGRPGTVRRAVPPSRTGPPWWDVSFFPVRRRKGAPIYLGRIQPVEAEVPAATLSLPETVEQLRAIAVSAYTFDSLSSSAASARRAVAVARLAVAVRRPALVHGPRGSGKLWWARVVHHQGPYRERPFIALDCDAFPAERILDAVRQPRHPAHFGRAGTVYLRQAAALPRDAQQELLDLWRRAGPKAGVPILGMTRTPDEQLAAGRLLDEWADECCALTVSLAALKERLVDLPRLCGSILTRFRDAQPHPPLSPPPETLELLRNYDWPGNLAELAEVLSAMALSNEPAMLPAYIRLIAAAGPPRRQESRPQLDAVIEQVERRLIQHALEESHGNLTAAADLLGVRRSRLSLRVKALGLKAADHGEIPPA